MAEATHERGDYKCAFLQMRPADLQIIPQIVSALQSDGQASIVPRQILEMQLECKRKIDDLDIQLYTPDGQVDQYGTFLLFVPEHRGNMYFHTTSTDPSYLESIGRSIAAINEINWRDNVWLGPVHERFHDMVQQLVRQRGLKYNDPHQPTHYLYNLAIGLEQALKLHIKVPDGYELRAVTAEDAHYINDKWPYRDSKSLQYIKDNIITKDGIALHKKESGEMVSWCLYSLVGGVGMLQTAEEHRGRGFGEVVARAMTKVVAENGSQPQIQIKTDIPASIKLFERFGYVKTHKVNWYWLSEP